MDTKVDAHPPPPVEVPHKHNEAPACHHWMQSVLAGHQEMDSLLNCPTPHRLQRRLNIWKMFAPKWVINLIHNGIPLPWKDHRRPTGFRNMVSDQSTDLAEEIEHYITKGILVPVNRSQVRAALFAWNVPKSSGKPRLVTNFVPANTLLLPPPHFSLCAPHKLHQHLHKNCWTCSIDLTDAYNHLKFRKRDRKYMVIQQQLPGDSGSRLLQWRGVGFGISHIPALFTKMLQLRCSNTWVIFGTQPVRP